MVYLFVCLFFKYQCPCLTPDLAIQSDSAGGVLDLVFQRLLLCHQADNHSSPEPHVYTADWLLAGLLI